MFGVDISLVDAAAIACALAFPFTRIARGWCGFCEKPHLIFLFLDLLRGATFFPFVLLLLGALNRDILSTILNYHRPTLFFAALIGAVSVFKSDRWMLEFLRGEAKADQK